MSPQEFIARFAASRPVLTPDVAPLLQEFVPFPMEMVDSLTSVAPTDKAILTVSGLPRHAAPFLSFGSPLKLMLQPLSGVLKLSDSFARYRIIGSNGSGDMICLDDAAQGRVVYVNHDRHMEVVLMNSSVTALGMCLCIFGELLRGRSIDACRQELHSIDAAANLTGCFWPSEIDAFADGCYDD